MNIGNYFTIICEKTSSSEVSVFVRVYYHDRCIIEEEYPSNLWFQAFDYAHDLLCVGFPCFNISGFDFFERMIKNE